MTLSDEMTDTTKQKTELIMKIISESGLDAYGTPEEFSNAIELAIAYGAQHENEACEKAVAELECGEAGSVDEVSGFENGIMEAMKAIRARGTKILEYVDKQEQP